MPDTITRPAPGPGPLLSRLAHAGRLSDVLPDLHRYALAVTDGTRSLLFEANLRTGQLHATSGYAVRELDTTVWDPSDAEAALVDDTFRRGAHTLVVDLERQMPDLAGRLGTAAALLIPIARAGRRVALLAVGRERSPDMPRTADGPQAVGDAFLAALDLFRLRQKETLQHDLRDLLDEHTATLATSLDLDRTLENIAVAATRFFAADRTSIWLHDRRARELELRASSDHGLASGVRVSADDALSPAAVAMRQARAGLADSVPGQTTQTIAVPLRAYRRALGTMLLEGVRLDTGAELDWLERADEVGRVVAAGIEMMQLLGDVHRTRRDLQRAIDAMLPLVVILNPDATIAYVNEAFARRVHTSPAALRERPLRDVVGAEFGAWVASLDARGDQGAAVCDVDDTVLAGSFSVTATDLPAIGHEPERQRGRVLVARELSSRSTADVEREELHNQLTQSEKLAALGQFVAGIAHELNNPLQSVLGHLELLRVTGSFPKGVRQQLQTVSREADRAAKIVRNLLVFAGSGRVERRPVSLNALLRRVVSLRLAPCRTAHIQIVRHYDEKLPRIKGDPLMLHQVLLNVLVNAEQAIAATGRPGRIEVTTAMSRDKSRVFATVRDTGPGISAEALSRVFEPFYTTKEVGKGTGLGLAIAYGIVHDHGGDIVAANHPDGGAMITVELPCGS